MIAPHRGAYTIATILDGLRPEGCVWLLYRVAALVCARWEAAGYTTFTRDAAGLPQPARPHPAAWSEERIPKCATCGRRAPLRGVCASHCEGLHPFGAVSAALDNGVPFGVDPLDVEQLPRSGVALAHEGTIARLARATCSPIRRKAA